MRNAKHYRKSNRNQKVLTSVAMTAALALSAGLPVVAAEADESGKMPESEPATVVSAGDEANQPTNQQNETDASGDNETPDVEQSKTENDAEAEEEDARTDEEKHEDNQTIAGETNPGKIDQNKDEIEKLPELDTGRDESGDVEDSSEQDSVEDTLDQKGEEIKEFELPDLPQAPEVDGLTQAEAEELKKAYESAVEEYNRLIEGEDGYNANVEAYNEALKKLEELANQHNQNTDEKLDSDIAENQDKVDENDQTVEDNKAIVDENTDTMEENPSDDTLEDSEGKVEDAGEKLDSEKLTALEEAKTELKNISDEIAKLDTSSMSKEEADAANELLQQYKNAVEAYETAIKNYNTDVETYRQAVESYNTALKEYVENYNKGIADANDETAAGNHGSGEVDTGKIGENETNKEGNKDAVDNLNDSLVSKGEIDAGAAEKVEINDETITITKDNKRYTLTLESPAELDSSQEELKDAKDALKTAKSNLEHLEGKSAEQIESIVNAYNGAVERYNEAVAQYNNGVAGYTKAIEDYKAALAAYDSVLNAKIESGNDAVIDGNEKTPGMDTDGITANGNILQDNGSIWNSDESYVSLSDGTIKIKDGTSSYTLKTEDGIITISSGTTTVSFNSAEAAANGVVFNKGNHDLTTVKGYNDAVAEYLDAIESYNKDVGEYNKFVVVYNNAMTAYQNVANAANQSVEQGNSDVIGENGELDKMLEFNDESKAIENVKAGNTYTVTDENGTERPKTVENAQTEYNTLKGAVEAAQTALNESNLDLSKPGDIETYNKLVANYNLAVANYNSFVSMCNKANETSGSTDVQPTEIVDEPLYVTTEKEDAQFYIVKNGTVPEETGTTGYQPGDYTAETDVIGTVTVGTMDIDNLVFDKHSDSRVEVVNKYTKVENEEGNVQFVDRDGNTYELDNKNYLTLVSESKNETVTAGNDGMYRYKYDASAGKLYVVKIKQDGSVSYATGVKDGYVSAYAPDGQDIIVNTAFNTEKFNFESEEALSKYFQNIGTLVKEEPNAADLERIIKTNFSENIYEAYLDGEIGIQWYVVKDDKNGTNNCGVHVDGVLYWKNTLEIVDNKKMNTLGTLKLAKDLPKSVLSAQELSDKLSTKEEHSITLSSLKELDLLTGGGNVEDEESWKEALSYKTLTPASPIVSPNDTLKTPTGSFVATEGLQELDSLTPIEGDEVIIKPSDPIVIIPIITPEDSDLIQEIVKEITPQLPELIEQGEAEAEPVEVAPAEAPQEKLPQTGQSWALSGLLSALGALLISAGIVSRKGKHEA